MTEQRPMRYVLITPAHNEAAYIEETIQSMIRQTVLPERWVIVNDGSTDETAAIIRRYLADHSWIRLLDRPRRPDRSFAGKVHAFNAGLDLVKDVEYEIVGNLDGDVSFASDYFEFLIGELRRDPRLGVVGTIFKEEGGYSSDADSFEGQKHVAGACQLFRRETFRDIGGYVANRAGGIDWIAVTTARMLGWTTRSFREKWLFHHRHLGTAERGRFASTFSYGEKDYYLGGHPVWELFRVFYRMTKPPYVVDGMALALGYFWALLSRQKRAVSKELMRFHRREQMEKLRAILGSLLSFRRVNSFQVKEKSVS